jgi:hypothetical protein
MDFEQCPERPGYDISITPREDNPADADEGISAVGANSVRTANFPASGKFVRLDNFLSRKRLPELIFRRNRVLLRNKVEMPSQAFSNRFWKMPLREGRS